MENTTTVATTPAGRRLVAREGAPHDQALVPGWVSRWSTAIVTLPVLFWLASLALAAVKPNVLSALSLENGVLETIQHLTLLAAVGVAAAASLALWWARGEGEQ